SARAQHLGEGLPDQQLVVDDQHRDLHGPSSCRPTESAGTGNETRRVAPPFGWFFAEIVPPTSRMICTETGRPSPVPMERVVKNGSKIFSISSRGMPTPVSRNDTSIIERRVR